MCHFSTVFYTLVDTMFVSKPSNRHDCATMLRQHGTCLDLGSPVLFKTTISCLQVDPTMSSLPRLGLGAKPASRAEAFGPAELRQRAWVGLFIPNSCSSRLVGVSGP